MKLHIAAAHAVFGLTMLAAAAHADPGPEEIERAESLYNDAITAFKAGNTTEAARLFRASYEIVPKPELLYNEAYALAKSGKTERASEVVRDALAEGLPAAMDTKARARLAAWERFEVASGVRPTIVAEPAGEPEPEAVLVSDTATPGDAEILRPVAYGLLGLGAVTLGAAGAIELWLSSVETQMEDASTSHDEAAYDAALQRGRRLQSAGRVTLATGGALLVTGVVIWLLAPDRQPDSVALVLRF